MEKWMKDIGATQKQFEFKERLVFQFNNISLTMDIELITGKWNFSVFLNASTRRDSFFKSIEKIFRYHRYPNLSLDGKPLFLQLFRLSKVASYLCDESEVVQ